MLAVLRVHIVTCSLSKLSTDHVGVGEKKPPKEVEYMYTIIIHI